MAVLATVLTATNSLLDWPGIIFVINSRLFVAHKVFDSPPHFPARWQFQSHTASRALVETREARQKQAERAPTARQTSLPPALTLEETGYEAAKRLLKTQGQLKQLSNADTWAHDPNLFFFN